MYAYIYVHVYNLSCCSLFIINSECFVQHILIILTTPALPKFKPPSISTKLCLLSLIIQDCFVFPKYSFLDMWFPSGVWLTYQGDSLKENYLSLPRQLTIVICSMTMSVILCPDSLSMLGFGLELGSLFACLFLNKIWHE